MKISHKCKYIKVFNCERKKERNIFMEVNIVYEIEMGKSEYRILQGTRGQGCVFYLECKPKGRNWECIAQKTYKIWKNLNRKNLSSLFHRLIKAANTH